MDVAKPIITEMHRLARYAQDAKYCERKIADYMRVNGVSEIKIEKIINSLYERDCTSELLKDFFR